MAEQIEYVQTLWDRIVAREHELPLAEHHRAELGKRLADHDASPGETRPWSQIESELRAELNQRRGE